MAEMKQINDAYKFLENCTNFDNGLFDDLERLEFPNLDTKEAVSLVQTLVKENWSNILQEQPRRVQRSGLFQHHLTVALENVIMDKLNNKITPILYQHFKYLDLFFLEKCLTLSELNVTPDQFGVPHQIVVPLPAAIVEFASLDKYKTPIDKIYCLETTYELILAELKGAIVNALAENGEEPELPDITNEIVIGLIMYVVIKSKPIHLLTNFYFIEKFQHTLSPNTKERSILNAFQVAILNIEELSIQNLNEKCRKIYPALQLKDVIFLTSEITDRFDKNGNRTKSKMITPYDLHLEKLMTQISAATLGNNY